MHLFPIPPVRFLSGARPGRRVPWLSLLAVVVAPGLAMGAQLTLTWTDNANNESGYLVERRIGGGSYSQIAVLAANSTTYTDPGLTGSTTHCYRVRAFNAAGGSGYSNEACKTTAQSTLNVTVVKAGTGSGTVSSSPAGITCGSDCTEAFLSGAVVTLTATPGGTASRFAGWSGGGCAGTAPCTLSGNASPTVTATFTTTGGGGSGGSLASVGTIIAKVTAPLGMGAGLSVIRDGDRPQVGSGDSRRQYDSWDGNNLSSDDWVGYTFPSSHAFNRMVFQEGLHFWDGGWFTTLTVLVRQNGQWVVVSNLAITPAYAGNDGVSYETYTLTFNPILGDAILLYGVPGGSAAFISVGELEVFAASGG